MDKVFAYNAILQSRSPREVLSTSEVIYTFNKIDLYVTDSGLVKIPKSLVKGAREGVPGIVAIDY